MCQISKNLDFVELKKDKIVYKLFKATGSKTVFRSLYMGVEYELEKMYETPINEIKENVEYRDGEIRIKDGIHSFLTKKTASDIAIYSEWLVFKCVIPAGSLILKGLWNNYKTQTIVSTQIIVKKQVTK